MLDELLEVFERDRKKNPNAPKQKGIRGFLNRLRDDDHDDRRYTSTTGQRPYRDDDDDRRYASSTEPRPYRNDDDDDDYYDRSDPNRRRRKEREGFDFFDD
jgi:hypothetical protein